MRSRPLLGKRMLRRLVHRFSEEGGGREGEANAEGYTGGGISQKIVEEIELDVDSEVNHSSLSLSPEDIVCSGGTKCSLSLSENTRPNS